MGGTAARAENGGGTTGRGMDRDGGGTSRADARQDARQARVHSAWSGTVVVLKEIIENSGMRKVIDDAVDGGEFRDLLGGWKMQQFDKGIKQEIDGLPLPTFAKIAFNVGSDTGGAAACKHDVEHWATEHPLVAALKDKLKTVIAQRDTLLAKLDSGVGNDESQSYADFGTLPHPYPIERDAHAQMFGVDDRRTED